MAVSPVAPLFTLQSVASGVCLDGRHDPIASEGSGIASAEPYTGSTAHHVNHRSAAGDKNRYQANSFSKAVQTHANGNKRMKYEHVSIDYKAATHPAGRKSSSISSAVAGRQRLITLLLRDDDHTSEPTSRIHVT